MTNTQALNAYSNVLNNPLSYTDPSGFFFSKIFKAIGNAFRAIGRAFMHAVRAIARSSIGRAILQIAACALGPHVCVAASGTLTLASGGSLKEAILAAGISFMQIGAYTAVGGVVSNVSAASGAIAAGATKLALHAVVGGAIAMAQGGDFATGALTGSISAGASLMTDASGIMGTSGDGDFGNMMARTTVSAVAGGTASVLAGGKFANGAITGAFAQMYNADGLGRELTVGVGTVLGGFAGGAVVTGGCIVVTGGACAAAAPGTLALGVSAGGATGAVMAGGIYDAVTSVYGDVHANSASSTRGTELYHLINRTTGEIDKIGVTSNPSTRYSQAYFERENVRYTTQAVFNSRGAAYLAEWIQLKDHYYAKGQLPRLNRIFR